MKISWIGTLKSRSVPTPRTINLPQRAIADRDESQYREACAHIYPWARTSNYAWAMCAVALGLGLRFYYVREMLASLALFSLLFLSLSLVVLGAFLVGNAAKRAAIWAGPASRVVIALFQQQGRGGPELARVAVVVDGRRLSDQRREVRTQMQIERQP
jgi:hypothetical protein